MSKNKTQFTVNVTPNQRRYATKVLIYDDLEDMRDAAALHTKQMTGSNDPDDRKLLGVCHRFEYTNVDDENDKKARVCIIRLARKHITSRIITHEAAHAAVWIHELEYGAGTIKIDDDNNDLEEAYCHILDEIVSQIIERIYHFGLLAEPKAN